MPPRSPRRQRVPAAARCGHAETHVVEHLHLHRVEDLVAAHVDVVRNGDPAGSSPAPGARSCRCETGRRPPRRGPRRRSTRTAIGRQRAVDRVGDRDQLAVVDDEDVFLAGDTLAATLVDHRAAEDAAVEEHARADAAVDMHLVVARPARRQLDLEEDRRKRHRNGGRGQHHLAKQLQRVRVATAGDQAHVPDHEAGHVEVGRADVQAPPALVRLGHALQQFGIDVAARSAPAAAGYRPAPRRPAAATAASPARRCRACAWWYRTGAARRRSPGREREGRHQRAGGHAGDDLEHRPCAGACPAIQEAGAEGAAGAAARQGQVGIAHRAVGAGRKVGRRFLLERLRQVAFQHRARAARPRRERRESRAPWPQGRAAAARRCGATSRRRRARRPGTAPRRCARVSSNAGLARARHRRVELLSRVMGPGSPCAAWP